MAAMGAHPALRPGEDRLFLYGSLMRGLASPAAKADDPGAPAHAGDLLDRLGVGRGLRRIGPCRVPGVLYDLGPYPALRPARSADEVVCGELHSVLDPGVYGVLDDFEGFDPRDPSGSLYLRERTAILEPRGGTAWIYVYNREPDAHLRIASGDWRRHLAERADPPHDCA